jgi:hypothetical protein
MLHDHASCPCYHVNAACPCCMYLLHVYDACPCCMTLRPCLSMLHVRAACLCCIFVLHVHAVRTCCTSVLHFLDACPCYISVLHAHVITACQCWISCPYWMSYLCFTSIHAACHWNGNANWDAKLNKKQETKWDETKLPSIKRNKVKRWQFDNFSVESEPDPVLLQCRKSILTHPNAKYHTGSCL